MQVVNPALVQSALNQLFGVSLVQWVTVCLVKLGYRFAGVLDGIEKANENYC